MHAAILFSLKAAIHKMMQSRAPGIQTPQGNAPIHKVLVHKYSRLQQSVLAGHAHHIVALILLHLQAGQMQV